MYIHHAVTYLLIALLFTGCNRLPYKPFTGGACGDVINSCGGLWVIDEPSASYVRNFSRTDECPIPAEDHFIWLFKDGQAIVHCKRDFQDRTYRYRFSASDDAYRETSGATMELPPSVPVRFRYGAFATWKVRPRNEVVQHTGDLNHPSDWQWCVDVHAGGHGYRLYVGKDAEGIYLAVPVYVNHYELPREFVRLRKYNIHPSIANLHLNYPLGSLGEPAPGKDKHLERLIDQFKIVTIHGVGKKIHDEEGKVAGVRYYIYDALFEERQIIMERGLYNYSSEGAAAQLLSTCVIRGFRDYIKMRYDDAEVGVECCPNVENGILVGERSPRMAFWITVTVPSGTIL